MFLRKKRDVHGFLLLDKPTGISSSHALQKVKYIFHAKKAGYIGTLDPLATGILPICFGECTKFSFCLTQSRKRYYVIAKLGEKTSTLDRNGVILKKRPILFTSSQLNSSIKELIGLIDQIPPMYSAIKYNGVPLYKYARQGLTIHRKKRQVFIYSIDFYKKNNLLACEICCSKGTYIRTLIDDLGEKLGCGAHVISLRRLQISTYCVLQAIKLDNLCKFLNKNYNEQVNYFKGIDQFLMPIDSPVSCFPVVYLSKKMSNNFKLGQTVLVSSIMKNSLVRVVDENKSFLGIGKINSEKLLIPYRLVSILHNSVF
ncbi:MAG: tRNA pseudouridine(55) synthase TruB [Buchnera aphidicola (Pentalonia nigronervosa)]|jgi:tRNA pseudouridine55 synthase|uniref:tRNA pseudouridine synthase B n=1 Tax=Buchnera aphidicola (Pentalonia nigronervosa) TaxID=1309793 RepID=A0A7H1AZZ2_9GAMM|nr:MAG: tRNA pseudouridine(55) synthase TruB [Buchnera aphidicola (Pentalonia nigronervosa)]